MSLTLKNIPIDWQLKKLKDVAEFSNGKGHEQSIDENGEYIVVNSKFISTDGRVKKFSTQNLSPLNFGDITMVMSDIPNGKAIAKCFIIDEENRYTLNQRICSIKSNENCDNKFLYYVINRNSYYLAFDNGVSQTNFRKEEVLDCPVQFPPLPEQQKIAEILSTVDAKIEVINHQITENQALKKGLMQRLLTKGIGHTEFKDSPLGKIPKNWEVVELSEICDEIFLGLTSKVDYVESGGYPFVRATDINSGRLSFDNIKYISEKQHKKLTVNRLTKKGDVLVSKSGTLGTCAIVDVDIEFSTYESIITIQPKVNLLLNKFLLQILQDNDVQKRMVGARVGGIVGHLNLMTFRKLKIPLPKIDEQLQISELLSIIDEKLNILSEKKTHYQELKKGLMQQLLTGKIRVSI